MPISLLPSLRSALYAFASPLRPPLRLTEMLRHLLGVSSSKTSAKFSTASSKPGQVSRLRVERSLDTPLGRYTKRPVSAASASAAFVRRGSTTLVNAKILSDIHPTLQPLAEVSRSQMDTFAAEVLADFDRILKDYDTRDNAAQSQQRFEAIRDNSDKKSPDYLFPNSFNHGLLSSRRQAQLHAARLNDVPRFRADASTDLSDYAPIGPPDYASNNPSDYASIESSYTATIKSQGYRSTESLSDEFAESPHYAALPLLTHQTDVNSSGSANTPTIATCVSLPKEENLTDEEVIERLGSPPPIPESVDSRSLLNGNGFAIETGSISDAAEPRYATVDTTRFKRASNGTKVIKQDPQSELSVWESDKLWEKLLRPDAFAEFNRVRFPVPSKQKGIGSCLKPTSPSYRRGDYLQQRAP
jgi:hypothetical protein